MPFALLLLFASGSCFGPLAPGGRSRDVSAEPTTLLPDSLLVPGVGGAPSYAGDDDAIFLQEFPANRRPARVLLTTHDGLRWRAPEIVLPAFAGWHCCAQPSPGGRTLYFESTVRSAELEGRTDTDLWVADRGNASWVNPRPLGAPFNSPHNEHNVTASRRPTICFNSSRPETRGHDILCATRTQSGWSDPRPLGDAVNSAAREVAPFIEPDERYLLFSSNRQGGQGGYDLYISVRSSDAWQAATNLGPTVNTAAEENNPSVSPDGRRLLFTRTINGRPVPFETRFDPQWLTARPTPD